MRIIANSSDYSKGTNKELADKFIDNIRGYFLKSFPNGSFTGNLSNGLGADHITFQFVMGNPKVSPRNDRMYHSVIIQWGTGFGKQPLTIAEGAELEFNVLSAGISVKPEAGSHLAMRHIKTGLTNVKKGGNLAKFDKKMKDFFPKLKALLLENKDNLYRVEEIDPMYFK